MRGGIHKVASTGNGFFVKRRVFPSTSRYTWKAVAGASDASKRQLRYTDLPSREGATASPRFNFSVIRS